MKDEFMTFKEYYYNHKTSTIGIATFLLFMLLVVLVCFFPYWFTREGNPDLCFKGTGEIGDTIGGIMGPFVAIIAAFLTFIAFPIHRSTCPLSYPTGAKSYTPKGIECQLDVEYILIYFTYVFNYTQVFKLRCGNW